MLARAKAREEGILKRQNTASAPATPSISSVNPTTKVMLKDEESNVVSPIKLLLSSKDKENLDKIETEMDVEEDEEEDLSGEEVEEQEEEMEQEMGDTNNEEDEEGNQEDEDNNDDEKVEGSDELLPLSSVLKSKPLIARTMMTSSMTGPQSASPISRKTRLSALAQSINSWEDDLTPVKKDSNNESAPMTAGSGSGKKGPRYSVSTPPTTGRLTATACQAQKRNSCHQFIATPRSHSVSPVKRTPVENSTPIQ